MTEFGSNQMILQVNWDYPIHISTGLQRDKLRMTILNNSMFFSVETMTGIPEGTSDVIKVPKMLPNDAFIEEAAEFSTSVLTGLILSIFFMNLFISGSMGLLWALFQRIQIISFLGLVNIIMPSNAHYVFKFLLRIATLRIFPSEKAIDSFEKDTGIVNDDFSVTETFAEFEFDSSGPIHNLQIVFLAMFVLATLPLFFLLLKLVFLKSKSVSKCVD